MEEELTISQVAKRFRVSPAAARQWAKSGLLKARSLGGMYFVQSDDLQEFKPPKRGRPITIKPKTPDTSEKLSAGVADCLKSIVGGGKVITERVDGKW